jgi:hypothetical protein
MRLKGGYGRGRKIAFVFCFSAAAGRKKLRSGLFIFFTVHEVERRLWERAENSLMFFYSFLTVSRSLEEGGVVLIEFLTVS